jgi:hypothetical protein
MAFASHGIGQALKKSSVAQFSRSAPDELTTTGVVIRGPEGKPAFGLIVCYC